MRIQIRINKEPFDRIRIVDFLKACDKSLSLKQAKEMVEKEIKHKVAGVDDILEFDLPNGSLVNVNINDYNPNGEFDINAAQGDEIPDELSLIKKTKANALKPGTFVLVRDAPGERWELGVFSHYNDESDLLEYPYVVLGSDYYKECIPLEGNEHLLNTNHPANSLPIQKEPKFDNENKRYSVAFGDEIVNYTDQELYNFIVTAVIRNRDICMFTVIDTENISRR